MRFSFDSDANALAIVIGDGASVQTVQLDSGTLVDLDADEELLTIEVLSPAHAWPLEEIAAKWAIGEADLRVLRVLREMFGPSSRYAFTPATAASENRDADLVGA